MSAPEAQALPPYRVRAVNGATSSENKIHDDEVAKEYGFAGGLVPGVTVFAHMVRPLIDHFGRKWLSAGHLDARFLKPVYNGDLVTVRGRLEEEGGESRVLLEAVNEAGTVCATGAGWLGGAVREGVADLARFPEAALVDGRPPASPAIFAANPTLGSIEDVFHAGEGYLALLDELGDDLPLWREPGAPAHPGYLIRFANTVLSANVRLGPWMHVESNATFLREVRRGDHLSTRANVVSAFERKGHRFVELEVLTVAAGEEPVMAVRHVAIYEPRRAAD